MAKNPSPAATPSPVAEIVAAMIATANELLTQLADRTAAAAAVEADTITKTKALDRLCRAVSIKQAELDQLTAEIKELTQHHDRILASFHSIEGQYQALAMRVQA